MPCNLNSINELLTDVILVLFWNVGSVGILNSSNILLEKFSLWWFGILKISGKFFAFYFECSNILFEFNSSNNLLAIFFIIYKM